MPCEVYRSGPMHMGCLTARGGLPGEVMLKTRLKEELTGKKGEGMQGVELGKGK